MEQKEESKKRLLIRLTYERPMLLSALFDNLQSNVMPLEKVNGRYSKQTK